MTYLSDLMPKTRIYSVKVTIATKNRAIQPVRKSCFQRLIWKDEKGATMDVTIYGDDIDTFNDIIQKKGEYKMSNAYVSRVNTNIPGHCVDYQMTISGRTLVRRLHPEASSSHTSVQYRQLISIPCNPYTTAEYALLTHSSSLCGTTLQPMRLRSSLLRLTTTQLPVSQICMPANSKGSLLRHHDPL